MGQWQQQPQQGHSQRGEKACSPTVLLLIFLVRIANPQSTQTNTAGSFAGIPPVPPSNNFVPPTQQPGEGARSVAAFPLTVPTGPHRTDPATINHRATQIPFFTPIPNPPHFLHCKPPQSSATA